jgi:hypothetical protein
MVYEWIERFKNGRTSSKHEEGARRRASGSFLIAVVLRLISIDIDVVLN